MVAIILLGVIKVHFETRRNQLLMSYIPSIVLVRSRNFIIKTFVETTFLI